MTCSHATPRCPLLARLAVAVIITTTAASARADDNDLVLSRLGTEVVNGGGDVVEVVGDPVSFRSLVSELGVVIAPRLLEPADTLGFSGFRFSVDLSTTSINNERAYWSAREGGSDAGSSIGTLAVFARKGMWFPLPSFEVGAGVLRVGGSNLRAAQGYAKFALHEGFHKLPIPSVAVRGAVSRMMGSTQLDLTVASVDVSASKEFGVGGVVALAPYVGWNWLIMVPRSEVIDKTPHVDSLDPMSEDDTRNNFVFADQDNILRNRLFGGLKVKYYVFSIVAELSVALAGSSTDDRPGTDMTCDSATATANCDATDSASRQTSLSVSVGVDF